MFDDSLGSSWIVTFDDFLSSVAAGVYLYLSTHLFVCLSSIYLSVYLASYVAIYLL